MDQYLNRLCDYNRMYDLSRLYYDGTLRLTPKSKFKRGDVRKFRLAMIEGFREQFNFTVTSGSKELTDLQDINLWSPGEPVPEGIYEIGSKDFILHGTALQNADIVTHFILADYRTVKSSCYIEIPGHVNTYNKIYTSKCKYLVVDHGIHDNLHPKYYLGQSRLYVSLLR